ncbi:conserved hypothetical protein, unlikely [Trypanosoma brucei gambiense DAL972]|uniref:Uncharacterized protein n=1 Tax=Trypanosoma brucei gambiense (strain MHOM/CI/86/DAL972) TaxID=679716 RepID=D0A4D9_TRYB9|nr:conserved hypothetical protein, unlikely [Trypanosoma brucei gambiense DAL972]CBH16133.1 conserved hypothetical protein, unlikely [Trypanosoma brucei gambiense DAL972]|eukprot:XP_011778397.1 conserved hypothetical protein, unlikely [Trypanosoma brucei gambiense DAL972]
MVVVVITLFASSWFVDSRRFEHLTPFSFFFLQRFVAVIDIRYCCYVPKLATVVPTQQTGWCVLSSACEGKGNVKSEGDSTQKLCERDEIATGWRGGCRNEGKEWNAMNHQKKKKI